MFLKGIQGENKAKRGINMKKIIFIFILFVLFPSYVHAFKEGVQAPSFELSTINGEKAKLADYKGKVVVLNFWTSWCEYCYEEVLELNRFYHERNKDEVELLAVNITSQERSEEAVRRFADINKLTFPVLFDKKGKVMKAYRIIGIPTTIIIDQQGVIRKTIFGPVTKDIIESEISLLDYNYYQ